MAEHQDSARCRELFYGNSGGMILGPYTGTDLPAMAFGRRWLAQPGNGGPHIFALRAQNPARARTKLASHLATARKDTK